MRVLRPSAAPALFVLLTFGLTGFGFSSTAFAAEIAELRNGFTIPHRSREIRGSLVRLYMDEARKSFVDIPAEQIQSFSTQPDPAPPPAAVPPRASEASSAKQDSSSPSKNTEQIVREASLGHGVDSDFIDSVIQQESAGNAHAVSRAGAQGLMQLMPRTAARLGVSDSFNREQNVNGGAQYLRELLERYHGDAIKALAAYNAGPGAVDRYQGVPPYRETRLYVQRIVRDYNRKKQTGGRARVKAASRAVGTKHATHIAPTPVVASNSSAGSNGSTTANN